MDYIERHTDLDLWKKYTPEDYPQYKNYDAINVDVTADVPEDYYGIMGVPCFSAWQTILVQIPIYLLIKPK